MKKRLVLILAFGATFSPGVLAAEIGLNNLSQTNLAGARCDSDHSVKKLSSSATVVTRSSSAKSTDKTHSSTLNETRN